jgi:hypothetical protein
MIIELDERVVRVGSLQAAPVDDELVILNLDRNDYNWLNPVGRAVWELIDQPCEVGYLCRRISDQFDASPDQIAADMLPFLAALVEQGLARVVSSDFARP